MRKGYTLAEMLIVMGIIVILALVSMVNLISRRNQNQLSSATSAVTGLLREAQSRSVSQSSSTSWGVHFENSTTTAPFFALFATSYSSSSHFGYYNLPAWVGYATSSVNIGSSAETVFSQISGIATGSSSISIYLIKSNPQVSSTIYISTAGSVSY